MGLFDSLGIPREVRIWWHKGSEVTGWAFDHYEVTLEGGDAFCEADALPPGAPIKDLLRCLRAAVGSKGYVPHAWKWVQGPDGAWTAPPKGEISR